ncbi:unnamed protein product [Choristocarpus tenellus]
MVYFRTYRGLRVWLDPRSREWDVVKALTEFMCFCCGSRGNQVGTIKGKISAIQYYHKQFLNFQLPTQHFMISSVMKGMGRSHTKTGSQPRTRRPLTWRMMVETKHCTGMLGREGKLTRVGLGFSFFFLARASELWAYDEVGGVHGDFAVRRKEIVWRKGVERIGWEDRHKAE